MIELKACPFCGSTKLKIDSKRNANFRHKDGKAQYSHVVTVRCNKCHTRGPTTSIWVDHNRSADIDQISAVAANLWNERYSVGGDSIE